MNPTLVLFIDRLTRWIAAAAAILAVVLSITMYADLMSANLPSLVTTVKLPNPPDGTVTVNGPTTAEVEDFSWDAFSPAETRSLDRGSRSASRMWFRITIADPSRYGEPVIANFNVGLLTPESVWLVGTEHKRGPDGSAVPGALIPVELRSSSLGTHLDVPRIAGKDVVLIARVTSPGVGKPKVSLMKASDFDAAADKFLHRTTVFTSILLILACFSAAVAFTSRDWPFLIFSGWLIASLRLVGVNSGWGLAWMHARFSPETINMIIPPSLCAYGLFTLALFRGLLSAQLEKRRSRHVFTVLQALFIALGLASMVMPNESIYPMFWAVSAISILGIVGESGWIALSKRDTVAAIFFLSWASILSGMSFEIAYNAGLISSTLGLINAETGALMGALLCALALAYRLKSEITGRETASRHAVRASQELKRNYESMPIGLFACNEVGRLTIFNPAFRAIFQRLAGSQPEPMRSSLASVLGENNLRRLLDGSNQAGSPAPFKVTGADGKSDAWLQIRLQQNKQLFEGTLEDVTERVRAEAALARLVDHDVVTDSLNLRGLNDSIARALQLAKGGQNCSLIELDVDRFKTLNDLYGHLVGDELLAAVSKLIHLDVHPPDTIARIGDSFRIVLFGKSQKEALRIAEDIQRRTSSQPIEAANRLLTITTSVGVVTLDPAMGIRDAMAASSQACADAKRRGRNQVVQLDKMDRALHGYLEELKVQENLQSRIDSHRFFLEFQPIVSLKAAYETLNYEVLVRMRGEDGSTIPPGRFIPAAERNGQMSLIDRWVLQATLRWLDAHPEHVKRLGYATVNLSGSSLNDARFVNNLFAMLADFPAVMSKICFEITETVALADQNATSRFSERVHSLGGKVALDDFGAGYTSFTYLREIDADIIKIDGSFVRDINRNPANHAITRMIVDLSHQLGKRCVAEWAEKPDVVATLMELGVDYGQGFGLAKPLPPSSIVRVTNCGALVLDQEVRALLSGELQPARFISGYQAQHSPSAIS